MPQKTLTKFRIILMVVSITLFLITTGCSGSSSIEGVKEESPGAYRVGIRWPREGGEGDRVIPAGSQIIEISIEGQGLGAPTTDIITYPDTSVTVENLPSGPKVATIKALDASSNVKSQRKESFTIVADQTIDSGVIPLGVAIIGDSSNPQFEPSTIDITDEIALYFQNWTDGNFTCRVNIAGGEDIPLPGRTVNGEGLYSFSDGFIGPWGNTSFSLVEMPSVTGSMAAPGHFEFHMQLGGLLGDGILNTPFGVGMDFNGNVIIADQNNMRIQKFDQDGDFLSKWGVYGTGNSEFKSPNCTAVDSLGNIYVTDRDNHKVKKYDSNMNFILAFGGSGSGNGLMSRPCGVDVDSSDNVHHRKLES